MASNTSHATFSTKPSQVLTQVTSTETPVLICNAPASRIRRKALRLIRERASNYTRTSFNFADYIGEEFEELEIKKTHV